MHACVFCVCACHVTQGEGKLGQPSIKEVASAVLIGASVGGAMLYAPGAVMGGAMAFSGMLQGIRVCHGCKGATVRVGEQVCTPANVCVEISTKCDGSGHLNPLVI